jgi:hypothetical protein
VTEAPTAPAPFNGTPDAEALYKAMKGFGTDEKVLNDIIGNRTREQLQEIKKVFEQKYGKTWRNGSRAKPADTMRKSFAL